MIRAGRPTATTSFGSVAPAGTSVPSPRNTRSPRRAPGMRIDALPISHRSPTVAPTTRQRCPNVVRRPTTAGMAGVPIITEFSISAEPVPTPTADPRERMTAPSDSSIPSPSRAVPITTADDASSGACGSTSTAIATEATLLMGTRDRTADDVHLTRPVGADLERVGLCAPAPLDHDPVELAAEAEPEHRFEPHQRETDQADGPRQWSMDTAAGDDAHRERHEESQ